MKTQTERHEEQLKQTPPDKQTYFKCKHCGAKCYNVSQCVCQRELMKFLKVFSLD